LKQNIQIWKNGNIHFFLCKLSFNIFSPLIINFFPKLFKNYWMVYIKMFLQTWTMPPIL
jgi:hypothetical protein